MSAHVTGVARRRWGSKGDGRGRHTLIVAATARPHRAYFASRVAASIAGVNRRSSAQDRWNSAGAGHSPAVDDPDALADALDGLWRA